MGENYRGGCLLIDYSDLIGDNFTVEFQSEGKCAWISVRAFIIAEHGGAR